jgi:hypothetical protein
MRLFVDRARVVEVLRGAYRLAQVEAADDDLRDVLEPIGLAELARTSADLDQALAGLPARRSAADAPAEHNASFSRLERSGRWELDPNGSVRSVCGTIELDLGHATLAARETTLNVRNWFGTITIIVPRGVEVSVDGGGPLGTREINLADAGPVPDAPRLRIHTKGVGGTLRIRSA